MCLVFGEAAAFLRRTISTAMCPAEHIIQRLFKQHKRTEQSLMCPIINKDGHNNTVA